MRQVGFTAIFALYFCTIPQSAHAYLDPGTGAIILQVLLGGIGGALIIIRLYWRRLKAIFRIDSKSQVSPTQADSKADQD